MARGKSGRGKGRGSMGDVRRRASWRVGPQAVNSAGVASGLSSWMDGTPTSLVPGGFFAFQAVEIDLPATAPTTNTIGEMQVDEIQGSIFFNTFSSAGIYQLGVGILIAKKSSPVSVWTVKNPTATADAQSNDWLFLRLLLPVAPVNAEVTSAFAVEVRLALPHPILIGQGEAVHVVVGSGPLSAGNVNVQGAFRTRTSSVA